MLTTYLGFNALLYAAFSLWCIIAPQQTSDFLGLSLSGAAGKSEYLAVYGGLQAGLAVFYSIAAFTQEHRRAALLLSLALYGGIVALRTIAGIQLGFTELGNARFAYGLEIALLLAAIILLVRRAR